MLDTRELTETVINSYEAGLQRASKQLTGLTYEGNLRRLDAVMELCKYLDKYPQAMTCEQFHNEIKEAITL